MLDVVFALAVHCAVAATPGQVYVAKYHASLGTLYHAAGCPDMHGIIKPVTRAEAERLKLEACPICLRDAGEDNPDQPSTQKIEELLEAAGIKHAIEQIPAAMAAMKSQPGPDGKPVAEPIGNALIETFKAPDLQASAIKALRKKARIKEIDGALPVFRSALARQFAAMEKAATAPGAEEQAKAFGAELSAKPASPVRVAAVEKIDEMMGATELQTELLASLILAIPRAEARKQRSNKPLNRKFTETAEKLKADLKPKVAPLVHGALLFAYRSASDADLAKYAELLGSTADMRAVDEAVRAALKVAIDDACDRAGAAILEALPAVQAAEREAAQAAAASPAPEGSASPDAGASPEASPSPAP